MRSAKRVITHGWRFLFVQVLIGASVASIGHTAAQERAVANVTEVSLAGTQFAKVQLVPRNQSLPNALIQAVGVTTPNTALNDAVAAYIDTKVQGFVAALPATPAVHGFFHQLRIVPHVDYVQNRKLSLTLQIDEYHPLQNVVTTYESWLADGTKLEQPLLQPDVAGQLAKVLHGNEQELRAHIGEKLAYGLLPNYKIRFYAAGYKDVPLGLLPSLASAYHAVYYPTYPQSPSEQLKAGLDNEYTKALARQAAPQDCAAVSCVALTFDDGPDATETPQVLDILAKNGVKATFFELGNRVQQYPDVTKKVAAAGHEIENHSFSHPDLVKLHAPAQIRKQIDDTQGALAGAGVHAQFLRPPYGSVDPNVQTVANMPLILWNVDAQEWRPGTTPDGMAASIVSQTRPGAIILLHDTKPITIGTLPLVIAQLKARNFQFVTISQLLQIDGNARGIYPSKQ